MTSDIRRGRAAFTAIELLIVLVVVLVLIGMAVPALVGAMRKGSVNDAANSIVRISSQARQFARTRQAPVTGAYNVYGLVLVGDEQPNYVALTYGTKATKANILHQSNDPSKPPVAKLIFNRNVAIYVGKVHPPDPPSPSSPPPADPSTGLSSEIGWMYQYRTGYPISDLPPGASTVSATSKSVNIGVDPGYPPVSAGGPAPGSVSLDQFPQELRHLSLRTADGRYKTAIAIYQIGLSNVQDY